METAFNRCVSLMRRTGYIIIQTNGIREYFRQNDPKKPLFGSEIFVGKLPRDVFEDEIMPLFGRIGPIYKIRLFLDYDGVNRGFCFITYYLPHHADRAVLNIHGFQLRVGHQITVLKSHEICRLHMNGIPTDKTKEEIRGTLQRYVEGIENIILFLDSDDRTKHRGFAFIDFASRALALKALNKLTPDPFAVWGIPLYVNWADREPRIDPVIMSHVKRLYLRNLGVEITTEVLREFLKKFVRPQYIEKIHKAYSYAFVHFVTRRAAEVCFEAIAYEKLNNVNIEVSWARPRYYRNRK